jgi:hypothetical protein
MGKHLAITDDKVISRIYLVRGKKVMLDYDLAELYGVETKRLKEAVRRNMERFPSDFMFELTLKEYNVLRTQFATLEKGKANTVNIRHLPSQNKEWQCYQVF